MPLHLNQWLSDLECILSNHCASALRFIWLVPNIPLKLLLVLNAQSFCKDLTWRFPGKCGWLDAYITRNCWCRTNGKTTDCFTGICRLALSSLCTACDWLNGMRIGFGARFEGIWTWSRWQWTVGSNSWVSNVCSFLPTGQNTKRKH